MRGVAGFVFHGTGCFVWWLCLGLMCVSWLWFLPGWWCIDPLLLGCLLPALSAGWLDPEGNCWYKGLADHLGVSGSLGCRLW